MEDKLKHTPTRGAGAQMSKQLLISATGRRLSLTSADAEKTSITGPSTKNKLRTWNRCLSLSNKLASKCVSPRSFPEEKNYGVVLSEYSSTLFIVGTVKDFLKNPFLENCYSRMLLSRRIKRRQKLTR